MEAFMNAINNIISPPPPAVLQGGGKGTSTPPGWNRFSVKNN
ncbi:hypothetical protein GCM10010917_43090 [Paenibacillus physcomitrellae]|uniref:Uncharacterized protein n=1 Tax=Paenibacillus physcomitrellae TaxID=1619311 RepID=A0ABQ1GZH4_9BACL|nr:hypothetical protein GCM10010917_43090 [Paenibacillus physcomitrellae]